MGAPLKSRYLSEYSPVGVLWLDKMPPNLKCVTQPCPNSTYSTYRSSQQSYQCNLSYIARLLLYSFITLCGGEKALMCSLEYYPRQLGSRWHSDWVLIGDTL